MSKVSKIRRRRLIKTIREIKKIEEIIMSRQPFLVILLSFILVICLDLHQLVDNSLANLGSFDQYCVKLRFI